MKRQSVRHIIAMFLVIATLATNLFPTTAYATEVGEQITETSMESNTASEDEVTDNVEVPLEESDVEELPIEDNTVAEESTVPQVDKVETAVLLVTDTAPEDSFGAVRTEDLSGVFRLTYGSADEANSALNEFLGKGIVAELDASVDAINEDSEKTDEVDGNEIDLDDVAVVEEEIAEIIEVENEKQVGVAIIDTGLDITSSAFANRLSRYTDPYMTDENGHGTLIAEIIASQTSENVKILPIKAFDENGKSTVGSVYSAILYAIERGADVINLSMSGAGTSTMLTKAIDYAKSQNVTVVVSAGNHSDDTKNYIPGNIESAITVSATDENKAFAAYSNYGELVDFSAMGTIIKDMGTEDTADDEVYFGTSIASAYISAYVAHILDNNENADIEKCLEKSAEDLGDSEKDIYYGKGYLTLESLIYDVNKDGSHLETEADKPTDADIKENELETPLIVARGEQIKNYSRGNVIEYRNIYEDEIESTTASWQGWIDWYAGMGYTYTGYTEAKRIGNSRPTYWMWLTKGGKQYWCLLYDTGAGNYASVMKTWINVGDVNGNNAAWYYIADNYLILNDGWLNCKISETNNNHSLRQAGWFYLNSSGQMQTGWHPDQSGKWYYFKMDETYHSDGSAIKVGESADGHGLVWQFETADPTYGAPLYHLKGVNIRTNLYLMNANGQYGANQPRTSFQSITPFVTSTYYYDTNYVNSYLNTGCYNLAYKDKTQFSVYLDNGDYNSYYIPDFTFYLARKNYSVHATKDKGIASVSGEGTYYHGAKATLSATVKPGYEFVGWKNANGTVVSTNPTYTITVTGVTDLEAVTKVIPYHIEIDYNGGTGDNPTDYNVESEDITLSPPTRPGYEFVGWTGSNGDTPQVDVTISQGTIGDLNYKANWKPNLKIFFDGNGSTSEGEDYEVLVEGDNFTWPENERFTVDEHSFQGWSIHNDSRYDSIDGFNGIQKAGDSIVAGDFLEYCLLNQPESVEIVEDAYVIHMYAVWDAFPTIKAKDTSIAGAWLDTMTENEIKEKIFKKVVGEDTEDGILVNNQDGPKGVIITDFDMDELRAFQSTGNVSITFRATDGAGNVAEKKVRLWVNSKNPVEGVYVNRARCINKKYYDAGKGYDTLDKDDPHYLDGYKQGGLMPEDLWYTDEILAKEIEEAFANLESENWEFSWRFTHEQVLETQEWIEEHGFGNSEEEGALEAFYNKYKGNITINKLPKRCDRGKHDIEKTTCTKAAYCKICGEVFGKPEHRYHREIGAKQEVCTACGDVKE